MPIRPFHREDIEPMTEILRGTAMFRPDEIEVAVELMRIVVSEPHRRDYMMYTYVTETGEVLGYYCVGPTPMTQGSFDLYWIAVHQAHQGKKVGGELMKHCEGLVRSQQGRLILAETSSQEKYDSTKMFYQKSGFEVSARIRDYYAPGDDLIIYTKYF
jgi:ribosomal protein S18 acetylase RimI-like enzyme